MCETHCGEGALFNACYAHLDTGVMFETNPVKVDTLAKQRPSWRVYEGDSTYALGAGIAGDLPIDLLDVDPYGSCWDVAVLQEMVGRYGNDLHPMYLEVCREMLTDRVGRAGYRVGRFAGYYCGHNAHMTHFLAVLNRT